MELVLCPILSWSELGTWNALLETLVELGLTDERQHTIDSAQFVVIVMPRAQWER